MLTESEARDKLCHMKMGNKDLIDPESRYCSVSRCMAWQWEDEDGQVKGTRVISSARIGPNTNHLSDEELIDAAKKTEGIKYPGYHDNHKCKKSYEVKGEGNNRSVRIIYKRCYEKSARRGYCKAFIQADVF